MSAAFCVIGAPALPPTSPATRSSTSSVGAAQTEVNTFPEHEFSSYFSGNTVQICPVGALTAQPYRFAARPWDLTTLESTSSTRLLGARVVLQSSQDRLVRILGVDSDAVNWSWLSDKERFSYEATDSSTRLTEPRLRAGGGGSTGGLKVSRWNTAIDKAVEALATASDPSRIGVLGGARLTLEAQYAWAKLLKGLGGIDNVDAQLADGLPADVVLGMPRATIAEAFQPGGVVVLLGPDLKEELPTLYLRLRHALENDGVSLIELTPQASSLSHYASARLHALSGTTGQVAAAVADGMVGTSVSGVEPADLSAAADLLKSGRQVTVIVGRANLAEDPQHVVSAMAAIQRIAPNTKFLSALRRSNIHGALEMGLTPGFLPGGQKLGTEVDGWPMAATTPGMDATAIVDAAANGKIDTLLLLGADPVKDFPDRDLIAEAMERVGTVIAVDTFETASVELADVILPATMFGEADGTFMNLEGRISPLVSKVTGPGQTRHDWIIATDLAIAAGGDLGFGSLDEIRAEMSAVVPGFETVDWDVAGVQSDGPVTTATRSWQPDISSSVPVAQSDDYGLRLIIDRKLWDLGTLVQNSSSLHHLAEPAVMAVNSADATRLGLAHGDTVPMTGGGVTLDAVVSVQPTIPRGAARISHALPGLDPGVFVRSGQPVTELRPAPASAKAAEPEGD